MTPNDACRSSPCLNGGLCITLATGFECNCQAGTSGDYCQGPDRHTLWSLFYDRYYEDRVTYSLLHTFVRSYKSHRRPLLLKSMPQWRYMYSGWRLLQLCLHWRIPRKKLWSTDNFNINNNDSNKRNDWRANRCSNRCSATTIRKYFCPRFLWTKLWAQWRRKENDGRLDWKLSKMGNSICRLPRDIQKMEKRWMFIICYEPSYASIMC